MRAVWAGREELDRGSWWRWGSTWAGEGAGLLDHLLLADGGQVREQQQVPVHDHLPVGCSSAGARSQLLQHSEDDVGGEDKEPHLDVLLGLQDVEDGLQAVLLRDLVEGMGHGGVELDEVGQGAVPRPGDDLGIVRTPRTGGGRSPCSWQGRAAASGR